MTEYLDRYPTMHEYAEGKRINPKLTDLISREDALEQMAQAECGLHYNDCEADNCSCSYIQRILDIPSAELPKGELISRADAIEAVASRDSTDGHILRFTGRKITDILSALPSAEAVQGGRYENAMKKLREMPRYLNGVKAKQIKKIPSEAEWIPCSERLPSESGDYLCTIPLDAEENYTEVLMFHKGRFYEDDAEWGATYHDDVLAWQPLPTPYKGGDDE